MRTSHLQYVAMVEFMEKYGDLSKPSGGPRGRHFIQMKWKELAEKLNSDGTGDSRSEEKWRKVWSDLKNNTKRKLAKINRAASGTGGGPALRLSLTDLENRVMQIIGVEAATGMTLVEAGFQQNEDDEKTPNTQPEEIIIPGYIEDNQFTLDTIDTEADWNTPSTSSQPTVVLPPLQSEETATPPPSSQKIKIISDEHWVPPPQKKKKCDNNNVAKIFVDSDRRAREYARERDLAFERLETERLRVHEYEVHERVRQRDQELNLQAQWLQFMKEAMNVIIRYFEKEDK
ncbi:uncharacterized protein LOC114355640 isoform X2 [Ostrinia furnacalis]|uniref:uncharacterized protein LOC114355640 isoform X2 n=1 Tax=Ostrinia furnacalis TaxID=93504 RepID=UPI0010393085|nr:uncharacterized protein LOC114355640 isoform X2 [Ostrinia furnacalis]